MPVQQTTQRWRVLEDGSKVRDASASAARLNLPIPRTHAAADALAAELDLEFPEEIKTLAQKIEYLKAH